MSLETWLANGWLVRHTASGQETSDLVDAAARDLDRKHRFGMNEV